MVRWYHAIFSAYGFWLPNDPRGSWSTFVASWELWKYGAATKTNLKQSLAHVPHDAAARRASKLALKYPPVRFNDRQRGAIAAGIRQACEESQIVLHACAVGFDHVHIILARHEKSVEQIVGQFKGRSAQHMRKDGCHPMQKLIDPDGPMPSPWSEGCWSVFINDDAQLRAAIGYVERHPQKKGLALQQWGFVTPPASV
jgi:REP-associated tyrosine transposase